MFSSYYDWNNFATDKNPALTLFIVQNFPLPSFHLSFNIVMSGSKAPDFDAHIGAGPKVFPPLVSKLIWA